MRVGNGGSILPWLAAALVAFALGADVASADPIVVAEPDARPGFSDLTDQYAGLKLTAITSVFSGPVRSFDATTASGANASTGGFVFGLHDSLLGGQPWAENNAILRADFALDGAQFVSLDFVANDDFDPGFLRAFDENDVLLAEVTSFGTLGTGVVETLSITRGAPDIAYVLAAGFGSDDLSLDNLVYDLGETPPPPIAHSPEPGSCALVGLAAGIAGWRRRRRKRKLAAAAA